MSFFRWRTLAASVVAFATACSYPDFHFTPDGSGGAGGGTGASAPSSSSSSSAGGGTGGAASSSSSSSSSSGAPCTVLHPGGGECEYQPGHECGCEPGLKCSVDDLMTGHAKCIAVANPGADYAKCFADSACAIGSWCDKFNGVCKPICLGNDCGSGQCVPAYDPSTGNTIPGLQVCTAYCDPQGSTCGPGVSCDFDTFFNELDCFASSNLVEDASCNTIGECKPGFVCVGGTCKKWCHPPDGFPTINCTFAHPYCDTIATDVFYNAVKYGACQ